jgi:hypothetical protein
MMLEMLKRHVRNADLDPEFVQDVLEAYAQENTDDDSERVLSVWMSAGVAPASLSTKESWKALKHLCAHCGRLPGFPKDCQTLFGTRFLHEMQ